MGDFHQNGTITTLHNLVDRPTEWLESDLMRFNKVRPISLVLPSLFSELETDALEHIVQVLRDVPYLSEIVIGLDRADEAQWRHARKYFARLPQHHRVLWNDGPRLRALDAELAELNLAPKEPGKGRNVWYCYGYVLASGRGEVIGLHDCDIKTYDRGLLARLVYPLANPRFSYLFCKGYYSRIADGQLKGRATRLLVTPLLRALKQTLGTTDYLEYMDSFRYALAGEFALRADVLRDLRIPSDWGLEIGVLSEMHRNFSTNRICQSEILKIYDHKHQRLSAEDPNAGLSRMSADIAKVLFRKLATQGHVLSAETFRTIKATYYRLALDFVDAYYHDAVINGLDFDRHKEERAIETFAQSVMRAGEAFLHNPMETPFIPAWSRVESAIPGFMDRLHSAVEADHEETRA